MICERTHEQCDQCETPCWIDENDGVPFVRDLVVHKLLAFQIHAPMSLDQRYWTVLSSGGETPELVHRVSLYAWRELLWLDAVRQIGELCLRAVVIEDGNGGFV